ncbi:cation:proton antiporter [Clostridium ganghwense]|uniref:Cation:proton antiporter n=1 Tax=Clostridium ganghwense TaxID=312089 RepID=A0ABT4CSP7_9CLOT|nr:cation:proton antiporter [Clostridium ganghwense]MCY6372100.1 cation:proton antiporter [Clostridium ganghwense]
MLSVHFLLDLAIILLSTKLLGLFTRKIQMPQVVGALLAGIILGPSVFGIVYETDFISKMSELGVIILMFQAGLETDFNELKKCGKASFVIAIIGVIIPLIGGFIIASFFNNDGGIFNLTNKKMLENIFIGVVLTATSVSITVETLQELGKLKTNSGTAIMGAAIIDDILGIIILTIVTSSTDSSIHLGIVLFKIVAFFLVALVIGVVFRKFFSAISQYHGPKRRIALFAFSFCLIMAFISEHFFGVADITGAYIAGVVISNTICCDYVKKKIENTSFLLLSPIFFASIGIDMVINVNNSHMLLFIFILTIIAILTKVLGCGLGAKLCRYNNAESLQIGIGMISRGEVALIIANKGAALGLLDKQFFAPIIVVVIVTTLITPILLKLVYSEKHVHIPHLTA